MLDVGPQRVEHGQDPVLARAGRRRDAARDLLLQHHVHVAHAAAQVEEAAQQRARDVVRQVADEPRCRRGERREVDRERVAVDDRRRSRARARAGASASARVELDRDHAGRARARGAAVSAPRPGPISRNDSSRLRVAIARSSALDRRGRGGSAGRAAAACGSVARNREAACSPERACPSSTRRTGCTSRSSRPRWCRTSRPAGWPTSRPRCRRRSAGSATRSPSSCRATGAIAFPPGEFAGSVHVPVDGDGAQRRLLQDAHRGGRRRRLRRVPAVLRPRPYDATATTPTTGCASPSSRARRSSTSAAAASGRASSTRTTGSRASCRST